MCRSVVENIYGPRYYWYRLMSILQCAQACPTPKPAEPKPSGCLS